MHRFRIAALASLLVASIMVLPVSPMRAAEFDLATATIADIHAATDAGALSAEKLVSLYLARIAAYDQAGPSLNSILARNPDALSTARALDAERVATGRRSPLHGIPVVVKDLINTADLPTTGGFIAMKGAVPARDAHVIAQLRAAGAIILAKTNMSDWLGRSRPDGGSSIAGQVLNPYDPTRVVAPSSSGTGAALAAWFATAGLGSETGTSIRNPTTDGSLVGLAPTEGLVGRDGSMANTFTHERIGPMARNTRDLALLLDHLVGIDGGDLVTMAMLPHHPSTSYAEALDHDGLRGARIGVLREMFRSGPAHAEGLALSEKAVLDLHRAGAALQDPVLLGLNLDRTRLLKVNYWEAGVVLDRYLTEFGPNAPFRSVREMVEKFPALVKPSFAEYADYAPGPDPEYQGRLAGRAALRAAVIELMDRHGLEALVFPYKTLPARKLARDAEPEPVDPLNAFVRAGDRVSQSDNYLSSMTGLPGLVVPMGYTADGAPLGLEFLGRPWSEATLIKLASGYEAATRHRLPPATTPSLPGERFNY